MRSTIDTGKSQISMRTGQGLVPPTRTSSIYSTTRKLNSPGNKFIQNAFNGLQPSRVTDKMIMYGFNTNLIALATSFLSNISQCVEFLQKLILVFTTQSSQSPMYKTGTTPLAHLCE